MKTITISGYVYFRPSQPWETQDSYVFFASENNFLSGYVLVGPAEFEYELPGKFDFGAAKIAYLTEQRRLAYERYESLTDQLFPQG